MKKLLFFMVMLGVLALGNSVALAGEGCDMKKGHAKELTAEGMKEHGNGHWWLFGEEKSAGNDGAIAREKPVEQANKTANGKLIGI